MSASVLHQQKVLLQSCLRGAAQVVFSSNALTGFLFLAAIGYAAFESSALSIGVGAVVALFLSTVTAKVLGYNQPDIEQGLFGFNGILVGIAIPTFFEPRVWMWVLLTALALLSVPLSQKVNSALSSLRLPALTSPFVFITWIGILIGRTFLAKTTTVELIPPNSGMSVFVDGFFKGFSQIFLINNSISGALILVALVIASRRIAVWGVLAALLSLTVSHLMNLETGLISSGLFSYNSILTGIALGAVFLKPSRSTTVLAFAGVILAVACQSFFAVMLQSLSLPNLTGPFVLASWIGLTAALVSSERAS